MCTRTMAARARKLRRATALFATTIAVTSLTIVAPTSALANYTATSFSAITTWTGDGEGNLLRIEQDNDGFLTHNRFGAGDPGFVSARDFDSTIDGEQPRTTDGPTFLTANGNAGDDEFSISHVTSARLFGDDGDDRLDTGSETLYGKLHGGDGNDLIEAHNGLIEGYGDAGDDTLTWHFGVQLHSILDGGLGNDALDVSCAAQDDNGRMYSANGLENIECELGTGNGPASKDNETIDIHLGQGNDRFNVEGDNVAWNVHGGEGDDSLTGSRNLFGNAGNDTLQPSANDDGATVHGGDGNDTIVGTNFRDTLFGNGGNDAIQAMGARDLVYGGDGNDALGGGQGPDVLIDGRGVDWVDGGPDNDQLLPGEFPDDADRYSGGGGYDLISYTSRHQGVSVLTGQQGGSGAVGEGDTVAAANDIESVDTTTFADTIRTVGVSHLNIGGGGDNVNASNPNGFVGVYDGSGSVLGDAIVVNGHDTVVDVGGNNNVITGGEGADRIELDGPNNIVNTRGGQDVVRSSGESTQIVNAGGGVDQVTLGGGANRVHAGAGNDRVIVGPGRNTVHGDDGDDDISGGGNLYGDVGRDLVHSRIIATLFGGSGDDNLQADVNGNGDRQILRGGDGNDQLYSISGGDELYGEGGNDTLRQGANLIENKRPNAVRGGAGNDIFIGMAQAIGHYWWGEAGNDTFRLRNRVGERSVFGGAGRDSYTADSCDPDPVDHFEMFAQYENRC